jgi:hypothetical protein
VPVALVGASPAVFAFLALYLTVDFPLPKIRHPRAVPE